MPLYRKTRQFGQNVTKSKEVVNSNRLPKNVLSRNWSFVPVEVRDRPAQAIPPPTPVPIDRAVSERTVRRIIRQIHNVPTLKGFELLCEVDGKLYTTVRQVYGPGAKPVK